MFVRKERFGWLSYDSLDQKPIIIETEQLPVEISKFCELVVNSSSHLAFLSAPTSLYVYPSMKCNKNCSHCYFGDILNKDSCVMSNKVIDRIIELVSKHGIFTVNILGGEPLMSGTWGAVKRLIDNLLGLDVAVNITTNGIELLRYLDYFKQRKSEYGRLLCLNVSLNPGDYKGPFGLKLRKALLKASAINLEININTVVIKHDIENYLQIVEELRSNISIKQLNLLYPRLKNMPLISAHILFCQKFNDLLGKERVNIETPFAHIYNKSEIDDSIFANFHYGCGLGKRTLSIAPDGRVYACSKKIYGADFLVGNIFDKLITLWNRAYQLRADKDLKLVAKNCQGKCRYYNICESCLADKLGEMDLACEFI